jgi:hypothetical protein
MNSTQSAARSSQSKALEETMRYVECQLSAGCQLLAASLCL